MGKMRRLFLGCSYLSFFTTTHITSTTTLATLALPFAAGFHSRFVSVSALRSGSRRSSSTMVSGSRGGSVVSRDSSAADLAEGAEELFVISPLIHSQPLSAIVGKPVYLKMDALQASGSFKVSIVYR